MATTELTHRVGLWNAAVALARLGDDQGIQFVVHVLLDRSALSQMPAAESGQAAQQNMAGPTVDRVMILTLSAAVHMKDPLIWDKIQEIADNDPSGVVRNAALQVLRHRPPPVTD